MFCLLDDVSRTLESEHAEKHNYGVVDRFVGHGVGTVFHSEPVIYHHSKYLTNLDSLLLEKT